MKLSVFFLVAFYFQNSCCLNCTLLFKRSKICKIYKYNEDCFQGKVESCELISIKKNQNKCPYYICNQFQNSVSSETLSKTTSTTNFLLNDTLISGNSSHLVLQDTEISETNSTKQALINTVKSETNITDVFLKDSLLTENSTNQLLKDTVRSKTNITHVVLKDSLFTENSTNQLLKDTVRSETNITDVILKDSLQTEYSKNILQIDNSANQQITNVLVSDNNSTKNNSILKKSNVKIDKNNQSIVHASLSSLNSSPVPTKNNRSREIVLTTNVLQLNVTNNLTEVFLNVSRIADNLNHSHVSNFTKKISNNSNVNNIVLNNSQASSSTKSNLNQNIEKNYYVTQDEPNWKEIEKIKSFSFHKKAEKNKLKEHFNRTLEKSSKIELYFQSIFSRVFSKMPIDCGTKSCRLEFHHQTDVRNYWVL